MAYITSIEKKDMDRNTKHSKASATYCVFEQEGIKFFRIDTCGSQNRECPGKTSQIIQFDGAFAKKLVSILIEEFWQSEKNSGGILPGD